jgi:hypothetical protein
MAGVRGIQGADGIYLHVGDLTRTIEASAELAKGKDGEAVIVAVCGAIKDAALNVTPYPISF